MHTTKNFTELVKLGEDQYLKLHGGRIENIGESLIDSNNSSVMLNCYYDEGLRKLVALYELENDGEIIQFSTIDEVLNSFLNGVGLLAN